MNGIVSTCYRDLLHKSKRKYVIVRKATAQDVQGEADAEERRLTVANSMIVQESYGAGIEAEGRLSTAPELVRGAHELIELTWDNFYDHVE